MTFSIELNVKFKIENEIYTADLKLPSGEIKPANPFRFTLMREASSANQSVLLEAAASDDKHIYVAVQPPMDKIKESINLDIIEELDIKIAVGEYKDGKFIDETLSFVDKNPEIDVTPKKLK